MDQCHAVDESRSKNKKRSSEIQDGEQTHSLTSQSQYVSLSLDEVREILRVERGRG